MIVTPGFRRRALVVALAGIYGMGSQLANANPTGAQVVNGQVALQTQGNKLTVTNTPGAIINWQSFSVGAAETTYFQQQNAASAVLNRVQAQNPSLKSQIDGTLGSNGRVFLINPNGIVFGAGSVIDTQGFVASTLNLNDADFKSGKLKFSAQAAAGNLQAKGRITSGRGDVYLVAPNIGVDGNAVITSQGGNIVLAAGEMVEITGRNLNDITFAIQSKDNQAINLGTLSGGAVGVFAGTLSHSGVIQAQNLVNEGGRLVLKAQGNLTLGAGSKTVADGNTLGGTIGIESQSGNVVVDTGSLVSAQATAPANPTQASTRGGDVSIQAAGGIVSIERDALISVDGGRGGAVAVNAAKLFQDGAIHADGRDTFGGSVSLQAGSRLIQTTSGSASARGVLNGGSIKLSVDAAPEGSGSLFTSATIDASAGAGVGGSVTVTGRDLTFAGARVLANGDAGGGTLHMGGGRGGKDKSLPNTQNLVANGASSFEASARTDGDGGEAVLWADGSNKFAGVVEARGGASGGNGGFIEVSGKQQTQFGGTANASAPYGKRGTFLLDPKYILIQTPASAVVAGTSVELLDPNPGNNELFGQAYLPGYASALTVLGNGNILVFNYLDNFFATNAGAVYLYNGVTGALISNLHGSAANDKVGSGGNMSPIGGAVVVGSPLWNGSAGALTAFDQTTGVSGAISSANSLVGSAPGDQLGSSGIDVLSSGQLAIRSPNWNSAAGAITWANGSAGLRGVVSSTNSLLGSSSNDRVGNSAISSLSSGKYYVSTAAWSSSAGAVTWIDGASPPTGFISSTNSLVGSVGGDQLGSGGIVQITGGNYLIKSPNFNAGAGAVTWANGSAALTGTIGAETNGNSIFGNVAGDAVGSGGIQFLDYYYYGYNYGNFVVLSPNANGTAGALTFGTATSGFASSAAVSSANSLVGINAGDRIGSGGIQRLYNPLDYSHSNYLIKSPGYNPSSSGSYAGAVTWASGTSAISGTIAASTNGNSIYGNVPGDSVGSGGISILGSYNFVVASPDTSSVNSPGAARVGAMSFGKQSSGFAPTPGSGISVSNSLVGTAAGDRVGSGGIVTLNNGDYLVRSPSWSGSTLSSSLGALTWGSGTSGVAGQVSSGNSLVGTLSNDSIGNGGITQLSSGNFVVNSPGWGGGKGAVTFGIATSTGSVKGVVGSETRGNSIFGGGSGDTIGNAGTLQLRNGNFVVSSPNFTNVSGASNAGAVTWGDRFTGFVNPGMVSSSNSLVGTSANDRVGINPSSNLLDESSYFLLRSPNWNNSAGAVTFSTGTAALTGNVGSANSLVGSNANDNVGATITFLNNRDYLVLSPSWTNASFSSMAGAVTFGNSTSGVAGSINSGNSLIGSSANDLIGSGGVTQLQSGGYLILSPNYRSGAGAVTWVNSNHAIRGMVGAETNGNSIFGNLSGDGVGGGGVQFLDYYYNYLNYGNFVVLSPNATNPSGSVAGAGAITFGDQNTGFTSPGGLSTGNSLLGASLNDRVGSGGIQRLYNPLDYSHSNYLIKSPSYDAGTNADAGAITWASGTSAVRGTVSSTINGNSITGNSSSDVLGSGGISILNNYNFVVLSPNALGGAGAVTFGKQSSGFAGPSTNLSSVNSLVGTAAGDFVGSGGIMTLSNSDYLVRSPSWSGSTLSSSLGALTWGSGTSGVAGQVGSGNSLVGSASGDQLGSGGIQVLSSGQLAIRSPNWNSAAGAITWANGSAGLLGVVSSTNSLLGSSSNDRVGNSAISSLSSGKYYVSTAAWSSSAGAVTWIDGASPPTGFISSTNSLVGSVGGDQLGSGGIVQLLSGNYLIKSPNFNAGAGAVTWASGSTAVRGTIGAETNGNSIFGNVAGDAVGSGGIQFLDYYYYYYNYGNFVVLSPNANGTAGALTFGTATSGFASSSAVSSANSLVGTNAGDRIGSGGIQLLYNPLDYSHSNYLIKSPGYTAGTNAGAGAITWASGTSAVRGTVGSTINGNSITGNASSDALGSGGISILNNYNFVVLSPDALSRAGAVTFGQQSSGFTGPSINLSSVNSLVGASAGDRIGSGGIISYYLANGDYIVSSPSFGSGSGALTLGANSGGITGVVSAANSLVGFGTNFRMVNSNTRLLVAAPTASSGGLTSNGRICLYAGGAGCASSTVALGSQLYSDSQSASVTITPAQITAITNNGTDVVLQANSDITLAALSDIITNNPLANGGGLTLAAGRSVFINSNIVTDNGNLTIIANDLAANGVSTPDRDPGAAEITMANGTLLDAGTGKVDIRMRDGLDRIGAQAASGDINLRSIIAGTLFVENNVGGIKVGDPAATSPSDIKVAGDATLISKTKILLAGGAPGAFAQLSAGGKIALGLPDPGQPKPVLELRNGDSSARILNLPLSQPIDLKVSDCITCLRISDSEFVGGVPPVVVTVPVPVVATVPVKDGTARDANTASLLSLSPVPFDHDNDTKKSKGNIEIEGGETCK